MSPWNAVPLPARARLPRRAVLPLLAGAALALPAAQLRALDNGPLDRSLRTQGRDAVWLGHAWVGGGKDDADATALLRALGGAGTGHGIRDFYAHVGPTRDDGRLDPALRPRAGWLLSTLRRPGTRVQAWLGDVVDSEGPAGLDLSRAGVRGRLVDSVRQLLASGFDGVNLDLEPVHSGDPGYLQLLDEILELTRSQDAVLSVAVPQTDPLPPLRELAGLLTGHPKWWSHGYLRQVAQRVDQVDVMAYDSGLPLRALFAGYVAEQVQLACTAVPPDVDLLIGLPAYHSNNPGHHARAETVAAAIRGVRLGLSSMPEQGRRYGVALYADFAATAADWTAYREDWAALTPA
ncbi:hypothetical protein GXW82_07560 [Streptacidiphilus sp. 4-A2]|nr:hypothetical protein [Streptacidiphilus sp. 4-A2]